MGRDDSKKLRDGICHYVGACDATKPVRIYADGPFAVNAKPPALDYMHSTIWQKQEDWNASAPFIDRYEITGGDHPIIYLDELNWWPLVYPLKYKELIEDEASLTGPSKQYLKVCAAPNMEDDHSGRWLQYQWIQNAGKLQKLPRKAGIVNGDVKNGLMDWGFGDAVIALGPMGDILRAGIRELFLKSLELSGVDLRTANPEDTGPEFVFITHSLRSYLALTAIDADSLDPQETELPQFKITPEERRGADYFSAHTGKFYFPGKSDRASGSGTTFGSRTR